MFNIEPIISHSFTEQCSNCLVGFLLSICIPNLSTSLVRFPTLFCRCCSSSEKCLINYIPFIWGRKTFTEKFFPSTIDFRMGTENNAQLHSSLNDNKVVGLQCKLLLRRINELRPARKPSLMSNQNLMIYNKLLLILGVKIPGLVSESKAVRSSFPHRLRPMEMDALNSGLFIARRALVFALVYTVRLCSRDPSTERIFSAHIITAFLFSQAHKNSIEQRQAYIKAIRVQTSEMLAVYDYVTSNLYWCPSELPIMEDSRKRFVEEILPCIQYTSGASLDSHLDNTCRICFADYEEGELVRNFTTCDHMFHASCLER